MYDILLRSLAVQFSYRTKYIYHNILHSTTITSQWLCRRRQCQGCIQSLASWYIQPWTMPRVTTLYKGGKHTVETQSIDGGTPRRWRGEGRKRWSWSWGGDLGTLEGDPHRYGGTGRGPTGLVHPQQLPHFLLLTMSILYIGCHSKSTYTHLVIAL